MKGYKVWILVFVTILLSSLTMGCGLGNKSSLTAHKTIVDGVGRTVEIPDNIERVIVFNAYNAELLNALNALNRVVGVDDFIYRDKAGFNHQFTEVMNVGRGGNNLNIERIIDLNPQLLIITGDKRSADNMAKKLEPFNIKVIVVNAYYTDEFSKNVSILGQVFNKEKEAQEFKDFFVSKLDYIEKQLKDVPKRHVYFEYRKKGTTTVPGDYFYWMVEYAQVHNIFRTSQGRDIDLELVVEASPAYIIKVSDPLSRSTYIPPTEEAMQAIKADIVNRPGWDSIGAIKKDRILLLSHYIHGGASKLVGTMYIAKFVYPEYLEELHPDEIFKVWLTQYQHLPFIEGHAYPEVR